jgi:hypothetical protein
MSCNERAPALRFYAVMNQALLALALLGLCAGCSSTAVEGGEPVSFRSLARGYHSGLAEEGVEVARNEMEWKALWQRHTATVLPRPEPPEVDFEREMVLSISLGTRPTGGHAVSVERVLARDGSTLVEAVERGPAPDAFVPEVVTQPYHMVAVPRRDGDVELRVRDQGPSRE